MTVTETLLRKRKPNAYGIALAPATPVYFGYHYSATGFGATLYAADGSWVSDRGEIATGDTLDSRATCILADAGEKVGVGSLVWPSDMQNLNVWDVEADATYTYAVADTYLLDGACYHGGYLWWIERDPVQHGTAGSRATWFRLIRARCDLTDVTQVGSDHEVVHLTAGLLDSLIWPTDTGSWHTRAFATSAAMNLVLAAGDAINGENASFLRLRMPFAGTSPGTAGTYGGPFSLYPQGVGIRTADGDALFAEAGLSYHEDAATLTLTAGWPTEAPWPTGAYSIAAGYSPATEEAVILSGLDADELTRHAYPTAAANPDVQVTVAEHAEWSVPDLIFPME